MDFDVYEFSFLKAGNSSPVTHHRDKAEKFNFSLNTDSSYTLEVKAYKGSRADENLAAKGTTAPFTVSASTTVPVKLNGELTGGRGKFSYNIKYPANAQIDEIVLLIDDNHFYDLKTDAVTGNGSISDSVDVTAGRHFLIVSLSKDGKEAGYANGVEIYPGQLTCYGTTDVPVVFSDADFKAPEPVETQNLVPESLILSPGATEASVNLAWYSETNDGSLSNARLYDASGVLIQSFTNGMSGTTSTGKRWHKAAITGLAAGTSYKYAVSNNNTDWSPKYDYVTAPGSSFKFAFVGDVQLNATSTTYPPRWGVTLTKIKSRGASFIVGSGDQVDSGKEEEYTNFYKDTFKNIPYLPVLGTHDSQNGDLTNALDTGTTLGQETYEAHYNPANVTTGTTNKEKYMSYSRYGNVLFIVLNTGIYSAFYDMTDSITRWGNLIDTAKAANPGVDWVIVCIHHTLIPLGHYTVDANDWEIKYLVSGNFEGMMVTKGVDFVLTGHEHVYARSHPIRNDSKTNTRTSKQYIASTSPIINPTGPIYITGPSPSDSKWYTDMITLPTPPYIAKADYPISEGNPAGDGNGGKNKAMYTLFEVSGKSMTTTAYTYNPSSASNAETVVDTFVVRKE